MKHTKWSGVTIYAKELEGHRECPENGKPSSAICFKRQKHHSTMAIGILRSNPCFPETKTWELKKPDLGPNKIWKNEFSLQKRIIVPPSMFVGRVNDATSQCRRKSKDF